MLIRRESAADVEAIRAVTAAAFGNADHSAPPTEPGGVPGEVNLVTQLRRDAAWIPALSLVALEDSVVIGHVVATRAHVGLHPALGLGPLSVVPARQHCRVGTALMHTILGAADALGESVMGLLGDPAYYRRFGFIPAATAGVVAPDPSWGEYFQIRTLTRYDGQAGPFRYAAPFDAL